MGERLWEVAAREFGYNPAEKRGWHGRWVHVKDTVRSVAGKETDESGRRMDARQRHRDANPNRLDRLADRINDRAFEREKARHDRKVAKNLAAPRKPRKPGEYDNISKQVRRNLERHTKA